MLNAKKGVSIFYVTFFVLLNIFLKVKRKLHLHKYPKIKNEKTFQIKLSQLKEVHKLLEF